MNSESLLPLVVIGAIFLGFAAGNIANKYIRVKGGNQALFSALAAVVTSFIVIAIGGITNSVLLIGLGIFGFTFEYSWCQLRSLDLVCKDGQYGKS